jgi:hypothetical protein
VIFVTILVLGIGPPDYTSYACTFLPSQKKSQSRPTRPVIYPLRACSLLRFFAPSPTIPSWKELHARGIRVIRSIWGSSRTASTSGREGKCGYEAPREGFVEARYWREIDEDSRLSAGYWSRSSGVGSLRKKLTTSLGLGSFGRARSGYEPASQV